ncbi:MAG: hypothetical protein OXH49_11445 [Gemmatimonadetes bacterium]|nr:hypothetical protein [Gemmatimonadota bacterium]
MMGADIGSSINRAARRDFQGEEGGLTTIFGRMNISRTSAESLLEVLAGVAGQEQNTAVASTVAGYSFLMLAETFCRATVAEGPAIDPPALLDSAVVHLTNAISVGRSAGTMAADSFANAALVGRARAHLQAGRTSEALADASSVPAGFQFDVTYVSDLADRSTEDPRVGNPLYDHTYDGDKSLSVAPAFRLDDPRVRAIPPEEHGIPARDGVTPYWTQTKYTAWDAPIRLASKLLADYIAAEAQGTSAMLDMIQARRMANDQPAYDGAMDAQSVLGEFLWQKSLDFYFEGTRMADSRRHPAAIRAMPVPGAEYHKQPFDPIRDQTCFPIPDSEIDNNPNLSG